MGRKKVVTTRTEYISFRVSALEKKVIELSADDTNLSVSNFVRKAALNMKVQLRFSPEELEVYNDLHKYHDNFRRISNLVKGSNITQKDRLLNEIEEVKELIEKHLKQFEK